MGVHEVTIDHVYTYGGKVHIFGDNFNKWCKVYINGEKVPTSYESGQILTIKDDAVKDGDEVVVNQVGSSDTIFRSSNKYKYSLPATTANTSTDSDSTEKE